MRIEMEEIIAREDRENAEFWKIMEKTLGDYLKEVAEKAKELEKPAPKPRDDPEFRAFAAQQRRRERKVRQSPLGKLSMAYSDAAGRWLENHREPSPEL